MSVFEVQQLIPPALELAFVQRALAAGLLCGAVCGVVGVFVVFLGLSALGVCLAHAAFAGALFAVLFDLNRSFWALAFSVITVCAVGPLARRGKLTHDSAIGILFSLVLGASFLFVAFVPGPKTEALSYFWGSILTLSSNDVLFLLLTTVLVFSFVILFFKEIKAVICHREIAFAVGLPANALVSAMLVLTGASISAAIPTVGGLLVYSLITAPAAAACRLSYNLKYVFLLAAGFGVLSCWSGLVLSYFFNLPSGATIVICSTLIFSAVIAFRSGE